MGEKIEASDSYIHHSRNIVEENPPERCPAEIRRSKTMANGPNIPADMTNKRSRCFTSGGNQEDSADRDRFCGEQEDGVGEERDFSSASLNSGNVNSQIRLLRSVSTPNGAVESMLSGACKSNSKLSVVEESAEEIGHRIESGGEKQVQIETLPRVPVPAATRSSKVCKTKKSNNIRICRANSENLSVIANDCCPPYGVMSIVGRRNEMEDTVAAVPSFCCAPNKGSGSESASFSALHFFGVYDGHGGSQASVFCRERLHETLAEELRALPSSCFDDCRRDLDEWKKAMTNCFIKIDIGVGGACPSGTCSFDDSNNNNYAPCCRDPVAPDNVGSTAVVAVVSPSQIIVASCGDSRAVLSRGGKAIPFSKDHKPEREDELVRIQAAGGRVIYWNGYRVGGFLAMSRAIGDRFLKQYVISEPEVTCTDRTEEDEFLILASDGLWDVLSNERVCDVARKCLGGYRPQRFKGSNTSAVAVAATLLTKLALARGSTDNISVLVIDLNKERRRNGARNRCPSLNIQTDQ